MKVFVTGGTGFVGMHLIQTLIAKNAKVSSLVRDDLSSRKPSTHTQLAKWHVDLKYGDITNRETLCEALDDSYDYVFHLAGVIEGKGARFHDAINIEGTRNLLCAIEERRVSVERIVFMSSISAMGVINLDRPLNEEVAPKPTTPYEVSKYKAEKLVESFSRKSRIPAVIVRAPMIYGCGEHSGMLGFARMMTHGIVPEFSDRASLPLVYVENLVGGLLLCAEKSQRPFDLYVISDARTYTLTEVAEEIVANLNIAPLRIKMPMASLRLASLRFKYLKYVANNTRLSIDKAVKELNYAPKESLHQGLKETVQYYLLRGMLECGTCPVSPYDTLKMGLKEAEGLGTAYEYYVKTKILTRYIQKMDTADKALIVFLPRLHGSVTDIVATLEGLGLLYTTINAQDEDCVKDLPQDFDVAIVVGDFLGDVSKLVSLLRKHSRMIVLFTANANNIFHVKGWTGTKANHFLEAHPTSFDYLDCPPFPSGVKVFSGKKAEETEMLKILMIILAFWSKVEMKLPTVVMSRFSHMIAALYSGGS